MQYAVSDIIDLSTYRNSRNPKNKKENIPARAARLPRLPVQPLTGEDILRAKDYLLNKPERYKTISTNLRDYTMFTMNINIGLRCSDLLALKISDVMENDEVVYSFIIIEQKTGKAREIPLREELRNILKKYIDSIPHYEQDWFLFHAIWPRRTPYKQMTVRNVNLIMDGIEKALNIKVPLGTHSMRKTFARAIYDRNEREGNGLGIQAVQQVLQHSSEAITRRYIGITREHEMKLYLDGDMI